jgi:hypothetical protein
MNYPSPTSIKYTYIMYTPKSFMGTETPNKTLYVKESDRTLWEKVQSELGKSLSDLFANRLFERFERKPKADHSDAQRMERIVVTLRKRDGVPTIRQALVGRWLVGNAESGVPPEIDDSGVSWFTGTEYSVAKTENGQIAVYERDPDDNEGVATLEHYDDFSQIRDATVDDGRYPMYPANIIAAVAEALNEPYEIDLDV